MVTFAPGAFKFACISSSLPTTNLYNLILVYFETTTITVYFTQLLNSVLSFKQIITISTNSTGVTSAYLSPNANYLTITTLARDLLIF
jgi:hypothetical protein